MPIPKLSLMIPYVLVVSGCGSHHIVFQTPGATHGSLYTCKPGKLQCEASTEDVPGEDNRSGTSYLPLPSHEQCQGGVQKLFIRNADSKNPEAVVTCANVLPPVETMSAASSNGASISRKD